MLTAKSVQAYHFIRRFILRHNSSPSISEVAEGIGIKSRGVVHRYVKALAENKLLNLLPNRRRNIELTGSEPLTHLPILGYIAAGKPIEAISHEESINLAGVFLGEDRFALKVKGDSMIDEGIFDGDIVVCQKTEAAKNGQIVVALIDNQEATLKRIQVNPDNTVALIPANASHAPMIFDASRVSIQGLFIGLLRFTH